MEISQDLIYSYFPELTATQQAQFKDLYPLFVHWNAQINVISRKDIQELYIRHVLHSLAIAKICTFQAKERVLDVGTGGGFPGIPLAILFPETQFTLVDSIGKKIKVVQEVALALKLNNVKGIHDRAEAIDDTFHFVISRAVTRLSAFYPWVKYKFTKEQLNTLPNGILYLKGGDLKDEIAESKLKVKLFPISEMFQEDFFETKWVLYVKRFT